MGAGVSSWRLARAVSEQGHLGVVSGTGADIILSRKLQLGDEDGAWRRALGAFPVPGIAQKILDRFYIPGGKKPGEPFISYMAPTLTAPQAIMELTIAANFAQVFLAKEGHDNPVGINLLEKIQMPTLMVLFGAMLAGVDYVNMGAGIPRQIPGILDHFSEGQAVKMRVDVVGQPKDQTSHVEFDPAAFMGKQVNLSRPRFLPIVTSPILAENLLRKATGRIDGFIVEAAIAGGHNAPPRGPMQLSPSGEPIYGPRDAVDPKKFLDLERPFWLAGGFGHPGKLKEALDCGATGIQVGTAFAFCEESGMRQDLKTAVLKESRAGRVKVFTDPLASPTGFPFKVVQLPGTLSDAKVYEERGRICDIGLLRHAYTKADQQNIGFRCPAEPAAPYLSKQGAESDMACRKCLCNGLLGTIGLGQLRNGKEEPPIITAGDDVADIHLFLEEGRESYTAADVIKKLLAGMA